MMRRSLRRHCNCYSIVLAAISMLSFAPASVAQETLVTLDPAGAQIEFTLGATLHTVHGSFKLKHGEIRFDPATGSASGAA